MARMPFGLVARPCAFTHLPWSQARRFSMDAARSPANKTQVYISRLRDPVVNLSVEHHLMQNTPPDSTILMLYTNSPCVIFGRNQNPWTEVNLPRLAQTQKRPLEAQWTDLPVQLVRRRSGGGCVFHDEGNVNFSVICPPSGFDRNKHAEMVVRALQALGRTGTSVNKRHDIVFNAPGAETPGLYKVSGSAYKLTSRRSLHHGTCLLNSPNLSSISGMLRSPGEPFIQSNGVSSVRTPVKNLDIPVPAFEDAVIDEFKKMYGAFDIQEEIDARVLDIEPIRAGCEELQTRAWTWGQTPRFTFSTHAHPKDERERPPLPFEAEVRFEARHGIFEQFEIKGAKLSRSEIDTDVFLGKNLYDIDNWITQLSQAGLEDKEAEKIGVWMNGVLGTEFSNLKIQERD